MGRFFSLVQRLNPVAMVTAVITVVALGPAAAAPQRGSPIPFTVVDAGHASGVGDQMLVVIRDVAGWRALWGRHVGTRRRPAPAIDFRREMVVAIFAGEARTPRSLMITQITREPTRIVVTYELRDTRPPLRGDGVLPTAPFQIVRLMRLLLPVEFEQATRLPAYQQSNP